MTRPSPVMLAMAPLLALGGACKTPETRINIVVPPTINGGVCSAFSDIACVNFLEFRVQNATASTSHCVEVETALADLCDVASLPDGRELFKLPPETPLPIEVEGKRVFPATSCGASRCDKVVFRGTTTGTGRIGDYVGRTLELTVNEVGGCGESEDFFYLDGGTCAQVCGSQADVLCEGVAMGCLCRPRKDGGQGGID
jgi:hypothetical protein